MAHCRRNSDKIKHSQVSFASFDAAHVATVNPCHVSQCLLGQSAFFANGTDRLADCGQHAFCVQFRRDPLHADMVDILRGSDHGIYDQSYRLVESRLRNGRRRYKGAKLLCTLAI